MIAGPKIIRKSRKLGQERKNIPYRKNAQPRTNNIQDIPCKFFLLIVMI